MELLKSKNYLKSHKKSALSGYWKKSDKVSSLCERCFRVDYRLFEAMYEHNLKYYCTVCLREQESKGYL